MKIGWIDYINTLPFQIEKFKEHEIVKAYPSILNSMLHQNNIDVGIISSGEYIEHYYRYFIIPDLSISSFKKVDSVIIASVKPLEDINEIYLTKESKTSVLLTKVIFEIFLKKNVNYKTFEKFKKQNTVLLIGDKALTHKKDYPYVYDLCEIWYNYTNLPFTFALWCVNKDYFLNNKEEVFHFQKKLKENVADFFSSIDSTDLQEDYKNYLKNLSFDLGTKNIESLLLFSKYLKDLNLIKKLPDFRFIDGKVITVDGTQTLYNFDYNEAYHSSSAGAYSESLHKFIVPCKVREICSKNKEINILDVGFGLGYNVATAIKNCENAKINIYSIEKDINFLEHIKKIDIPENLKNIYDLFFHIEKSTIKLNEKIYQCFLLQKDKINLTIIIGDGRDIIKDIKSLNIKFDAVFWDPFSPKVNREMWTVDIFKNVKDIIKTDGILATYSAAISVKKSLLEAGFKIGLVEPIGRKSASTVATLEGEIPPLPEKEFLRIKNSNQKAIYD